MLIGSRATDGASYLGVAALSNFELNPKWRLTASFGPGYYSRNRNAKDLGSSIEFLSNCRRVSGAIIGWRCALATCPMARSEIIIPARKFSG